MGETKVKVITLRAQGSSGSKRIELPLTSDTKSLYENVKAAFDYSSFNFALHKDKKNSELITACSKQIGQFGLKHGDTIFITPLPGAVLSTNKEEDNSIPIPMELGNSSTIKPSPSMTSIRSTNSNTSQKKLEVTIDEDEIDLKLATQSGLITRSRDSRMCKHGETGCCLFCAPLEPYDEAYLQKQNIKHMSFHSYLRKLQSGVDKGKFAALEDLSIRIKDGCTSHSPWPAGICSRCQPSAITLNRQVYRHVDNVMFENPHIVEKFLTYWRLTGFQRAGFLYGKYEEHTDVPLGIRATVKAIYEPPQESGRDFLNLIDSDEAREKQLIVNEIAKALELKCVGWIFTDLIPEDTTKGTVKLIRGIHSHFLSAQECATMAHYQNLYPNPCKLNSNGIFGSKFATVLVTGDETNQVHMVGYQASNQCMALVRENCFLPTKDVAELGYIKESSAEQYVPDVFYKKKNEYGFEEQKVGRPLPVEYLLVEVPVSTPKDPQYTFTVKDNVKSFPVENRLIDGQLQDFTALATYLSQFPPNTPFLTIASDFHFLLYITTLDIVPISNYIGPLLEAVKDKNEEVAIEWSKSELWATVDQLVSASNLSPTNHLSDAGLAHGSGGLSNSIGVGGAGIRGSAGSSGFQPPIISPQETWTCAHCTYFNSGNRPSCEVCNLPRL